MSIHERVAEAVKEAEDAFWEVMIEKFPEAKTGDMLFDEAVKFEDTCHDTAKLWVALNTDLLPDHWVNAGFLDDEKA